MMCPDCGGNVEVTAGVIAYHRNPLISKTSFGTCSGTGTRVSSAAAHKTLQEMTDLAPMLRYAASLCVEGQPGTPYFAMLASIKGELNRLFEAMPADFDPHSPLPKESP